MQEVLKNLSRSVAMLVGIGRQVADTDETRSTQRLQIALPGNVLIDGVPHLQQYGLASRSVPGADIAVICIAGDRSRPIAIASGEQRNRPSDLKPGEVALYHPKTGSHVLMRDDGSIHIEAIRSRVDIDGDVNIDGTLNVSQVIKGKEVKAGAIDLGSHKHGGVQPGNGVTSNPQ